MTTTMQEAGERVGGHPRRWLITIVLMAAALMDMIDSTIVNVALPSIGRGLRAGGADLEWTVSAYMLGFAATLIIAGHLGDRYGRKAIFLGGVACFGLASLACGLAPDPGELIAARAVQGVAAAALLPQVLASFRTLFEGKERGTVFGIYGAVAGVATALGVLLGGLLVDANLFGSHWRSIFLINVPVAVAVLALAGRLLPADKEPGAGRPDLVGSLVLAAGLVAIVLPLAEGNSYGWPMWGWFCMAAGAVVVVGLGVVEGLRGSAVPLLPGHAFRIPAFSAGLLVQLLFGVGLQGFFLIFSIWLQSGQGYSPAQTGALTVAFSCGAFLSAPAADGLATRLGRIVLLAGALLMAAGLGWVAWAVHQAAPFHTGAWPMVPGLVLSGIGLGFLVVPLVNVVLSAVPREVAGAASGIFSTAQQFGGALGVAAIGSIFFGHTHHGLGAALTRAAPWAVGAFLVAAALCLILPKTAVTEIPE
jgi:EmrB/QacA subfamily drug resistance transporter